MSGSGYIMLVFDVVTITLGQLKYFMKFSDKLRTYIVLFIYTHIKLIA